MWVLLAALLTATAAPTGGAEIALVLDNSCSMILATPVKGPGGQLLSTDPPNDPDRAAVLGALVVEGLVRGSTDGYTAITLPAVQRMDDPNDPAPPVVANGAAELRDGAYVSGTASGRALRKAVEVLEASARKDRLLLYFTDGRPSDKMPQETNAAYLTRHAVPPASQRAFDTFAIGLYRTPSARDGGKAFLDGFVRNSETDLFLTDDGGAVVPAFVRAFGRAVGSVPRILAMDGARSEKLVVPKYATEVMVASASNQPGPAYSLTLTGASGTIAPTAIGDNGCALVMQQVPTLCNDPRRHYVTYRAAHDPRASTIWTLASAAGTPKVDVGVLFRHNFDARAEVPAVMQVGAATPVRAHFLLDGAPFSDAAFLADGFTAAVDVNGATVPLSHVGNGVFEGAFTPTEPVDGASAKVTFANAWMEVSDTAPTRLEGTLDLALVVPPLSLADWRGESGAAERCTVVDLNGSRHADVVPVTCSVSGLPADVTARCEPDPDAPAAAGKQPLRWRVCVTAPPCCAEVTGPADVLLQPTDPRYADRAVHAPLAFHIEETGFLRCWAPWLQALAGALAVSFVAVGMLRPYSFEEHAIVRIALTEAKLASASASLLRDLPKGRRGFYRSARLSVDSDGECVRAARGAAFVVVAGPNGTMRIASASGAQYKNRVTGKWVPLTPEDMSNGPIPGTTYRTGKVYLKFGG